MKQRDSNDRSSLSRINCFFSKDTLSFSAHFLISFEKSITNKIFMILMYCFINIGSAYNSRNEMISLNGDFVS